MKLHQIYIKIFVYAACIAILTACGGADENQDTPLPNASGEQSSAQVFSDNRVKISALTLNGYVANALVWVDFRANDSLDGFEPFAYSDNQGFVSYNPNTGVDYCASEDSSLQRFCLQTGTQSGKLILKAAKGIELLSGEAFRSVLTQQTSIEQARDNFAQLLAIGAKPQGDSSAWQAQIDANLTKLSPLTSLAYYLPDNSDIKSILLALDFDIPSSVATDMLLSMDYIAGIALNNPLANELFAADATFSRLVDTITINLDKAGENIDFGENGLPLSGADAVYQSLAQTLASQTSSTTAFYSGSRKTNSQSNDRIDVVALLSAATSNLLADIQSLAPSTPTQSVQQIANLGANQNIIGQLDNIVQIATNHFANVQADPNNPQNASIKDLFGAFQTLTLSTLSEPIAFASTNKAAAINILNEFLEDQDNRISDLIETELASVDKLDGSKASIVDLVTLSIEIIAIASQSDGAQALASEQTTITLPQLASVQTADDSSFWTGKRLSLSGFQDGTEQGQVIIYFNGQSNVEAGELIMCVAYRNDANPTDNIRGQLFKGTWSLISSGTQNRLSLVAEGFNIQMKVQGESVGRNIPSDQQIPSLPRMPNETYGKYGFTLNQESATWHSDNASVNRSFGLLAAGSLPVSADNCKSLLSLQVQ